MRYIIRGMMILVGILLIFMLLTSCAPGKNLRKDDRGSQQEWGDDPGSDEFGFDDTVASDNNYQDERKRIYDRRDKKKDDEYAGNIKSGKNSDQGSMDDVDFEDNEKNDQSRESYYQTGMASWYGREFHGRTTASGEKFNMNQMTAAHKTLPFGTEIIVKNLDNGKKVKVTINDRGPYREGRILDLSFAAAKEIDILRKGEAMIGITIFKMGNGKRYKGKNDDDIEPVAGDEFYKDNEFDERDEASGKNRDYRGSGDYSLQAGAFYSKRNASNLKKKLEGMFNNSVIIIREGDLYKVRVKGIENKNRAQRYKKQLDEQDISSFIINGTE